MSDKNDETGGIDRRAYAGVFASIWATWTVTSTTSLKNKKPLTFDITIEQNRVNASYAVTGWSISSLRNEIPVLWTYERMEDGDKVYDMVMMPTLTGDGVRRLEFGNEGVLRVSAILHGQI